MSDPTQSPPESRPSQRVKVPAIVWLRQMAIAEEIDAIQRYLDTLPSLLRRHAEDRRNAMPPIPDSLSDEDVGSLAAEYAQMQDDCTRRFPSFVLETSFVSTYAFLDDELKGLCGRLQVSLSLPTGLKKKGPESLLQAAKNFLADHCQVTAPEELWRELNYHRAIRNAFAHESGRLPEKDRNLIEQYVEANRTREGDKDGEQLISVRGGRLHISHEFCSKALDTVQDVLFHLYRSAGGRVSRNKR